MNKDAYYFPHFCNARHDRKIQRIRKHLGIEGYARYFMLLEVLRDQTEFNYPVEDIDLLATEFNTSEEKVKAVVLGYGLFEIEGEYFTSPKLIEYLQPYFERSDKARKAALKRWNSNSNAQALPKHTASNASKVKYSKVNESKGEYSAHVLPDVEDCLKYFKQNDGTEQMANDFYLHYDSQGWVKSNGRPIEVWQSAASKWINTELHNPTKHNKPKPASERFKGGLTVHPD